MINYYGAAQPAVEKKRKFRPTEPSASYTATEAPSPTKAAPGAEPPQTPGVGGYPIPEPGPPNPPSDPGPKVPGTPGETPMPKPPAPGGGTGVASPPVPSPMPGPTLPPIPGTAAPGGRTPGTMPEPTPYPELPQYGNPGWGATQGWGPQGGSGSIYYGPKTFQGGPQGGPAGYNWGNGGVQMGGPGPKTFQGVLSGPAGGFDPTGGVGPKTNQGGDPTAKGATTQTTATSTATAAPPTDAWKSYMNPPGAKNTAANLPSTEGGAKMLAALEAAGVPKNRLGSFLGGEIDTAINAGVDPNTLANHYLSQFRSAGNGDLNMGAYKALSQSHDQGRLSNETLASLKANPYTGKLEGGSVETPGLADWYSKYRSKTLGSGDKQTATGKASTAPPPGEDPKFDYGDTGGKPPQNPDPGDTFTDGNGTWTWDGKNWKNENGDIMAPPDRVPSGGGGPAPPFGGEPGGGGGGDGTRPKPGTGGGGKPPLEGDGDDGGDGGDTSNEPPDSNYDPWNPTNYGTADQYQTANDGLYGYYKKRMNSKGMDPEAYSNLVQSTMVPLERQAAEARERMTRARAATGNDAGIYAGIAQTSKDAAAAKADQMRSNVLADDQVRRSEQAEGAAGNLNLYGQTQAETMEYLRMLGNLLGRQQSVSTTGSSSGVDAGISWNPGGSQM